MTNNSAPKKARNAKSNVLGHVTYLRLTPEEAAEAKAFAEADDRTMNGFIRTMYRRGLEAFKAQRS